MSAACTAILIAACSHAGSPADPPANFQVVPGDGRVTVTWTANPSVNYWLFYGPGSNVLPSNWTSVVGSNAIMNAFSPYVVTGLLNGTTYSFSMNGRTGGGAGGTPTASVTATPRVAGATWTVENPVGANDLRGVMVGSVYVAVGLNGGMYSSTDGQTWTQLAYVAPHDLYAANYDAGVYTAVGATGTVLYSTDAVTWTVESSAATVANNNNLNAEASNGSTLRVAVGDAGTIIYSTDGQTWHAAVSSATGTAPLTSAALYGVSYAPYGTYGTWIAVGANGTILKCTDGTGSNWSLVTSGTSATLKSAAYGVSNTSTGATSFVVVGAGGAILTSADSTTWNPLPTPLPTTSLNAVVRGTRFVAVGDAGTIFYSDDATTWTAPTSWLLPNNTATTQPAGNLYAIVRAPYDYAAVGQAGLDLYAQ